MKGGEVLQLEKLVGAVLSKVSDVIARDKELKGEVKRGLRYIWGEMRMATLEIESIEKNQGATHATKIVLLKELASDIEDFIDLTWIPGGASGLILAAVGMDPRHEILKKINNFKDNVQRVRDWKPDAGVGLNQGEDGAAWSCPSAASAPPGSPEAGFVGIDEHINELQRRLLPAAEGQPRELRVISIVGCRGVGKTALARAVYDAAAQTFPCRAWVEASKCNNAEDLLSKIHVQQDVAPTPGSGGTGSTNLRDFLQNNRYLIVIDDVVRADVWQAIKHEFPENDNDSRIIVTTNVHSVAAECSWGSYVYTMQGLGETESEKIFWEMVGQENRSPALEVASDGILKKCGGLPLALISAANYLRRRGQAARGVTGGLTTGHCKSAARALGDMILKGKDAEFVEINRALLQCYNNLPDSIHRSCLLYASVFPRGRPINSKVLISRWIAEGLVVANDTLTDEQVVPGCLEEFIDRSIVEPVLINNARVAMFRVHSIMLEFIIHKAVSENFVALVDKDELLHNKEIVCAQGQGNKDPIFGVRVRRLSVQDSKKETVDKASNDINLSAMRSLTICRSHLLDIQACKLLRVLDLGGCQGVNNIVRDICKLQFLKYLSLRGTDVGNLPLQIRHLKHLEILDIRDTGVEFLPIEVIKLPMLAHLFGRFELPHEISEEKLKDSRLQTLAGVVINKADPSFEKIILHARKLRKVKIYQTASDSSNSFPNKKPKLCSGRAWTSNSALLKLKERFIGREALQILSIDSSDFSTEFVSFLEAPCELASIKLRGKLERLPATLTLSQLVGLNKLLLISTGLSSEDLSALQDLHYLEYLKLAEDCARFWAGTFVVHDGGFPSLKRLCFEAPKLPKVIFRAGSMKSLTILDLLCPYPEIPDHCQGLYFNRSYQTCGPKESRLGVAGISDLENLNEVILHHSTGETKMRDWKDEAIRHKNRPAVKRQPQPTINAA